jgi:phosphatidylserine/phosphatidylglycerophosphate/cardiolipin synthase-like enzyme
MSKCALTALLCFALIPAAGALPPSSAAQTAAAYGLPAPSVLPAPPEAGLPLPVFSRGDFSQFPGYSFAYLNDLNSKLIDASVSSVDVVMFSATLKDNPEALLRAAGRGVRVRVIFDEGHVYPEADPEIKKLIGAPGVAVRTLRGTRSYGVNHNKILVCDKAAVAAGSYNWTFGATFSNHENTLVSRSPVHVEGYSNYFEWMWSRARTPEQGPAQELPEGYYGTPPQDNAPQLRLNGTPVPAYLFSPGSRSEERLAALMDAARVSVDAVTFTFSSRTLADAVLRAHRRGVKVRFLTDKNMGMTSAYAKQVFDAGVPMRWGIGRNGKGAMHDKFMVLDGQVLQTGSFNWTVNASKHSFENMIFTGDQAAVKAYQATYETLYNGASAPAAGDFQVDPFAE